MKTITVNDREFQYEICYHASEYGECEWTNFYEGSEFRSYKKYLFFGPNVVKSIPNKVFHLNLSIEDESYTKSEIRRMLENKIELLNRREEIEKGEII